MEFPLGQFLFYRLVELHGFKKPFYVSPVQFITVSVRSAVSVFIGWSHTKTIDSQGLIKGTGFCRGFQRVWRICGHDYGSSFGICDREIYQKKNRIITYHLKSVLFGIDFSSTCLYLFFSCWTYNSLSSKSSRL